MVESDQPGRTSHSDGGGFRSRMDESCPGTPTHLWPSHASCGSLDRPRDSVSVTRRRLVNSGLLAFGTAVLVTAPIARASSTTSVWGLDPDGCGCSVCAACRKHAANKIFASPAEADAARAHPRCRCVVTELSSVEPHVFETLFVNGGRRSSVDRRWQWVQAALVSAAPIPPPSPQSPSPTLAESTSSSPLLEEVSIPEELVTAASGAAPTLRAAWIRRLAPGRRVLFVQIGTDHAVEAEISLIRDRTTLARRHVPTISRREIVQIPLGPEVTRGPAQVRIRFTETGGPRKTVFRMLSVPSKQPARSKLVARP